MGFYDRAAMRMFGQFTELIYPYFSEVKSDLKKSGMKISSQEYLTIGIFTSFLLFCVEVVLFSYIFGLVFQSFIFGFITSFTSSIFISVGFFMVYVNYPKISINSKAKKIDNDLPFATLYLATIAGSKIPLHKTLEVFAKFGQYGEVTDEFSKINNEIDAFGLDVNTALERSVERTPSSKLKDLLWGILSVSRTGGDVDIYLKEKSKSFVAEYRRKIYEFSQQLSMFLEIYITAVILGAVFFTILTAIMTGISTGGGDVVTLQVLLIFFFIPLISTAFIVLIKSMVPGGE
jgi:flagellar protein FlaJ